MKALLLVKDKEKYYGQVVESRIVKAEPILSQNATKPLKEKPSDRYWVKARGKFKYSWIIMDDSVSQ